LPDIYAEASEAARLSKKQSDLFLTVAAGNGRLVSFDTIIDRLWGHDPNGGPIAPKNVIAIFIGQTNHKLRTSGYRIENVWGQGYRLVTIIPQVAA